MSHKGIRLLIENTARSLGDDIQFTYARTSDFNILRDKRYPFITLDTLRSSASFTDNNSRNYVKVYNASMAFYDLDKESSTQEEYAQILDDMDVYVDSFITKLNFFSENDTIVIISINQSPFIKAAADILTGHFLDFQIQVPDNWEYCADGC